MARLCLQCGGTGKRRRPKTADHILTDTMPSLELCSCGGSGVLLDDSDHDSAEELRNERILREQDREELRRHE